MNTENGARSDWPGTGEVRYCTSPWFRRQRESPSERWCLKRAGSVGAQKISVFPKGKKITLLAKSSFIIHHVLKGMLEILVVNVNILCCLVSSLYIKR